MREFVSSVSPKGQITLPLEIRRLLGIKPRDKVAIHLEAETVTITPARSSLHAGYQSIGPLPSDLTDSEMTEIAADEHAERAAREGC